MNVRTDLIFMEEEQDVSPYTTKKKFSFSVDEFPEELFTKRKNFLTYGTPDISRLLRKILPLLYKTLDQLIGGRSRVILPKEHDFLIRSYQEVLRFLKSEGIMSEVSSLEMRFNDAPHFFRSHISSAYPKGITDGATDHDPSGYGFGKNEEITLSKAIGEFLERYFFTLYKSERLLRGSIRQIGSRNRLVDLSQFASFSSSQKEADTRFQYGEDDVFSWEKITRFSNKTNLLIPAQFVYWNYHRSKDEPILRETNTNGAGGFFSREGAILSGLYELIQRDAFLIYWLNKLSPPKIIPESVPNGDFQYFLRESKKYGFKIHCLNITSDIIVPSFAVVIEDDSGCGPRFSVGAGAESDPAKALLRALEEAWAVYYWLRPQVTFELPKNYEPFRDSSLGRIQRLRLWAHKDMASEFSFFLAGSEDTFSANSFDYPSVFSSETDELTQLIAKIEGKGPGYEVYCYMAKHSILSSLGYRCAKVIVPQLVPLYLRETLAPLGSKRLREVPENLGYTAAAVLNPLPHPFP